MRVSTIYIDHIPTPWQAHGGYGKRSYDKKAKEKEEYRRQIGEKWGSKAVITTPVKLTLIHYMPIPKNTSKARRAQMLTGEMHHMSRPDVTNLNKLAEDTLKGIVLIDDSIVFHIEGVKIYSEKPGVHIFIEEVTYKHGIPYEPLEETE